MEKIENTLTGLLQLTEEIHKHATEIRSKMEDNEAEQLETLQYLFEKREQVIQQLKTNMQKAEFYWTDEDRKVIQQLKVYEEILQPLMNGIHQSFLTQINRINQTKQVSKKYIGAYQNMTTDGSFFDKRK